MLGPLCSSQNLSFLTSGIDPWPLAVGTWSPLYWTIREFPEHGILYITYSHHMRTNGVD